jgi:outer membrane protein OmpA-like peptidoglycan-associated protein
MKSSRKGLAILLAGFILPALMESYWLQQAEAELHAATASMDEVAIASVSEENYCSAHLKRVLRRVAGACGLITDGGRGCKPADAKSVAAVSGDDFNTLFRPLAHRAAIIQFDANEGVLDETAKTLIEESWSGQRGASFFFVVSRASPDGNAVKNQELSRLRAGAVLEHLTTKFEDPDIKNQVGLLWLGEEFAQLGAEFCEWNRSREDECTEKEINRSAFVAWIDCAI